MDLINTVHAQNGAAAPGSSGMELLILVGVFFLIMYFVVIRPQSKRNKAHRELLESLTKGVEVTTTGGLLGRIVDTGENFITLEVTNGVTLKVQKNSIAAMMPKGTMQSENTEKKKS